MVPVARFQGSRLASGPSPSPYQKAGAGSKRKWDEDGNEKFFRAHKAARMSSGATIGAAIVEAESNLENEVCSNVNFDSVIHTCYLEALHRNLLQCVFFYQFMHLFTYELVGHLLLVWEMHIIYESLGCFSFFRDLYIPSMVILTSFVLLGG